MTLTADQAKALAAARWPASLLLTRAEGLTMLRLSLILCALVACNCHPQLPPVSGCVPGAWRCADDRPEMCSASQRWEPAGDTTCAAIGGVCVVRDGSAHCGRAVDASAVATDGGAP